MFFFFFFFFFVKLASFGQLDIIGDLYIKFQKSRNVLTDKKDQKFVSCTVNQVILLLLAFLYVPLRYK